LNQIAEVSAQDPGQDADEDAPIGAAAVTFQVKLPFERPVDGFDDLAQRLEQVLPGTGGLALAGRPQQYQLTLGELVLEVPCRSSSCPR
jgi:hypothetical protein